MSSPARRVRVKAFAKINLGLKVLGKRPDGYHELRTVYQTISLADRMEIEYRPSGPRQALAECHPHIPDNLAVRAALLMMEAAGVRGEVRIRIEKQIPMGAGLGGGSSDAAAVLLALPVLTGKPLSLEALMELAARLGSDVPFFLLGGTALGVGRGEEVYPLPEAGKRRGLLVVPDLHVSTAEAYQALGRGLTTAAPPGMISCFQSFVWRGSVGAAEKGFPVAGENDFERVVFRRRPRLKHIKDALRRLGAEPALMSGSGSALYGIFRTREELKDALPNFQQERAFPFEFLSRAAYRAQWRRCLGELADEVAWPPKSRRAKKGSTD